jgi:hypothetical protein
MPCKLGGRWVILRPSPSSGMRRPSVGAPRQFWCSAPPRRPIAGAGAWCASCSPTVSAGIRCYGPGHHVAPAVSEATEVGNQRFRHCRSLSQPLLHHIFYVLTFVMLRYVYYIFISYIVYVAPFICVYAKYLNSFIFMGEFMRQYRHELKRKVARCLIN